MQEKHTHKYKKAKEVWEKTKKIQEPIKEHRNNKSETNRETATHTRTYKNIRDNIRNTQENTRRYQKFNTNQEQIWENRIHSNTRTNKKYKKYVSMQETQENIRKSIKDTQ